MATVHPSLTLVLDVDEGLLSQELKLEIARCYAHIGSPVVRSHAAAQEGPAVNTARFIVSMGTARYLMSEDEGADARWAESVQPWLASMFFKVGNNMASFNRRMRKIGMPEIDVQRIDVELQQGAFVVGVVPHPQNTVPRAVADCVGLARELLNDGTLAGAVRVDMPGAQAYRAQEAAAREVWDAQHAAIPDEPKVEEAPAQPSGPMKHYVGPMPDRAADPEAYEQWERADREAKSYEQTAVPPTDSDTLPPIGNPPEPAEPERFDFDVDYSSWDVRYPDGSVRVFDAALRTFVS